MGGEASASPSPSCPLSRRLAVIEMPNIHSLFLFEHEFDDFLCASIGEEENGMALSVMSAFARRNVDPWEEAARLSRLPRDVATRELCAIIAELPSGANSRQPAIDSGASDGASAFFRRLRRFVGHGAPKGGADAARNRQNRGGSLVSLGLDGVRGDRSAIGVPRTRPGADIRCDRQREMTSAPVTCSPSPPSSPASSFWSCRVC